MRSRIANSRLVIIQRAYHAFTLEMPAVTMRQIEVFLDQVSTGKWRGDQSVWIANDDPAAAEPCLPCAGDWTRAVQVATRPAAATTEAGAPSTRRKPVAAPKAAKAKTVAAKPAAKPAAPAPSKPPRKAPAGRKTP
jgi:hypothetical protein